MSFVGRRKSGLQGSGVGTKLKSLFGFKGRRAKSNSVGSSTDGEDGEALEPLSRALPSKPAVAGGEQGTPTAAAGGAFFGRDADGGVGGGAGDTGEGPAAVTFMVAGKMVLKVRKRAEDGYSHLLRNIIAHAFSTQPNSARCTHVVSHYAAQQ